MFSLVNKHEEFFDFLVTNAEYFHKGTQMAREVLQDPSKLERYVKDVKNLEHSADKVTHEISAKMRHVFITPSTGRISSCLPPLWMTAWMISRMW